MISVMGMSLSTRLIYSATITMIIVLQTKGKLTHKYEHTYPCCHHHLLHNRGHYHHHHLHHYDETYQRYCCRGNPLHPHHRWCTRGSLEQIQCSNAVWQTNYQIAVPGGRLKYFDVESIIKTLNWGWLKNSNVELHYTQKIEIFKLWTHHQIWSIGSFGQSTRLQSLTISHRWHVLSYHCNHCDHHYHHTLPWWWS